MRANELLLRQAWGQAIRDQRKVVGLTQKQLAVALDVSFQSVSQWENGETAPRDDLRYRIADVLRCEHSFLFHRGGVA